MEQLNYKELYDNLLVENQLLKDHLKKYTAPVRNKNYYHNNKEKIAERNKEKHKHKEKDPAKIKEYNKKAYQKRKEKIQLSINS